MGEFPVINPVELRSAQFDLVAQCLNQAERSAHWDGMQRLESLEHRWGQGCPKGARPQMNSTSCQPRAQGPGEAVKSLGLPTFTFSRWPTLPGFFFLLASNEAKGLLTCLQLLCLAPCNSSFALKKIHCHESFERRCCRGLGGKAPSHQCVLRDRHLWIPSDTSPLI